MHYQWIHQNPNKHLDKFLIKNRQKKIQRIIPGVGLLKDNKLGLIPSQICIVLRYKQIIIIMTKLKRNLYVISSF